MFHRAGLTRDFAAALLDFFASLVGVLYFDRDVAVTVAQLVGLVSQL